MLVDYMFTVNSYTFYIIWEQWFIAENQHKEIIVIDEIDKMSLQHQEGLLTMMERGQF